MSLNNLSGILIFLVMLYVVEMFPITFASTSWKCMHRKTVNDKVKIRPIPKSLILWYKLPISSVSLTYKNFFKNYGPTKVLGILSVILFLPRIIMFLPFMDSLAADVLVLRFIYMFSVPILLLGLIIFHILHVYTYFKVMRLFQFGTFSYIILFIAPYFIAALLNSSVPQQLFRDKEKLSSRFDENYKVRKKKVKSSARTAKRNSRDR